MAPSETTRPTTAAAAVTTLLLAGTLYAQAGALPADELYRAAEVFPPGTFSTGGRGIACDAECNVYVVNSHRPGTIGRVSVSGEVELFTELPQWGGGAGLRYHAGALLLADPVGGAVISIDTSTRQVRTLSTGLASFPMNNPQDLVVTANGSFTFISDADWYSHTGRIWCLDGSGAEARVARDLGEVSGISLSPDETTLYVGEGAQQQIWAFDVLANGRLGGKRLVVQFAQYGVEGLRSDESGFLYVARSHKGVVAKLSPAGDVLMEIELAMTDPVGITFGGADGRTVYVTSAMGGGIESFRTEAPGRDWVAGRRLATATRPHGWGQLKRDFARDLGRHVP